MASKLPPLKALLAFRYAAEVQSFKLATERLHLTQAAISQQIKILEQHLGLTLFRRLTREVVLTPEGQQLLPFVSQAFTTLEQGVAGLGLDTSAPSVDLECVTVVCPSLVDAALGAFSTTASGSYDSSHT